MAKSSFWGMLPETDWHDWPEQYPSTYPGDTGIECLWRTLPRCIPPSEGCPRIIASTRLLHTERRFGITLAAAGSEWTDGTSRYQQEATRYQRNHQLPRSLSQPSTSDSDPEKKKSHTITRGGTVQPREFQKMIATRNWKPSYFFLFNTASDCLDGTITTSCQHTATHWTSTAAPESRMQPLVSGARRWLAAALALKSRLWCL